MSKISQRLYLKDKYKVNLNNIKKEVRVKSTHEETLNRDYYEEDLARIPKIIEQF